MRPPGGTASSIKHKLFLFHFRLTDLAVMFGGTGCGALHWMLLHAWGSGADVRVRIGVDVGAAVDVGAGPGAVVDEDGVATPTEACAEPAEAAEVDAERDGCAEADGSADEEAGPRGEEDYSGIVVGNVVERRIEGLDLEVSAVVDYVVVLVVGEVAVVLGLATHALDGVHYVLALGEDGVAELGGPAWVLGERVEDRGEGQERENAGVEVEIVSLDGGTERVAGDVGVLVGPVGGVGNFVPVGGGG